MHERAHELLQVLQRDVLAIGHLAQGDLALGITERRDVDHEAESVPPLGRNEHAASFETMRQTCRGKLSHPAIP